MTENHYRQPVFMQVLLGGMLFVLGAVAGGVGLVALQWTMPDLLDPHSEMKLESVELPNSEARLLTATPSEVFVGIDAAGKLSLDGVPRTQDELREALSQRAKASPVVSVIIRVDKRVEFQRVADVMGLCDQLRLFDRRVIATTESGD